MTDARSPLATTIIEANPDAYQALVVSGATPDLARKLLAGVEPAQLLIAPAASPEGANAMLAGLWLWHDGLEESHKISQKLLSPTGSFWHAIMHRREGGFSHSKEWYARAGNHPILPILAAQAGDLLHSLPADRHLLRIIATGWNPAAFVDLVEEIETRPNDPRRTAAVSLQQLEWRVLFDHCARQG